MQGIASTVKSPHGDSVQGGEAALLGGTELWGDLEAYYVVDCLADLSEALLDRGGLG